MQFLNDKLLLWQGSALLLVSIFSENRKNFLEGCSNSANTLSNSRMMSWVGK
jgi:hypothetical protein